MPAPDVLLASAHDAKLRPACCTCGHRRRPDAEARSRSMHFDLKLWRMTAGQRGRIALSAGLGLLALAVGIARFAFLASFLAGAFRGTIEILPLTAAATAI